ncbi:DUF1906 domain-containing protein [Paenibacillus antri]|uniref:DUF1906 domain-containing protein n=1 Tax=Paenibacillus antri TaxID=2582848 RepID=A0A5R9GDQ9_9BACL|nr:glycoside hydrolase domain-containing protein [Paenibacillus antri]TLS51324.1 DUF1906 domain-containing protein [Paenibacillus antri]
MIGNRKLWACLVVLLLAALFVACSRPAVTEPAPTQPPQETPAAPESPESPESIDTVWGIDTASLVDDGLYACVRDSFGEPAFVGRYLETKEGVSYGIAPEEVKLLHGQGIKILPIYNHFTDATAYDRGVAEAEQAIEMAGELGIPEGVAIFADVEPTYPVDAEFIRGWTETMLDSPYVPGMYAVFVEASESKALSSYLAFAWQHQALASQLAVWTSDVDVGVTTKANAPTAYEPEAEAVTTVDIWQYGIDAETCNIDTNLMRSDFLKYLW